MNIKIICVGKVKETFIQEAIKEYTKRISKYAEITICEVPDEIVPANPSPKEIENIKKAEAEKILKQIKATDFVIALDLKGKEISSEELASKIENITLNGYSTICFLIGGTLGFDKSIIERSGFNICFSKLTFPHQLIRLFLVEQIFRSFKIINNEKYHW